MGDKLLELNAVLRLYESNFRNLHWNAAGIDFNDSHKSISTDYYDLCGKYVDITAEMIVRLSGQNPPNYVEVGGILENTDHDYVIIDSTRLYSREDIVHLSDTMLGDICTIVVDILTDEVLQTPINAGIKSDLEAMLSEFDLQYRYINKRRITN